MNEASKPDSHLPHLDGIRALLALYVAAHHCYLTIWPLDRGAALPPAAVGRLVNWLLFGRLAVAGFIALSGYCLMLPVVRGGGILRGGAGHFYFKRARRILPTFYAALIFCAVIGITIARRATGTVWDSALPITWKAVAVNLLMVQNLFARHQINYAFWSIAVEYQIYFFFPLLVILFARVSKTWTTFLVVLATLVVHKLLDKTLFSHLAIHYLGIFTLGMFAACVPLDGSAPWPWKSPRMIRALSILMAVLFVALCGWWGGADTPAVASEMLAGATLAMFLIFWRGPTGLTKAILQWPPIYFVGTFSYSLYLLHAPIIQIVWQYITHPLGLTGAPALLVQLGLTLPACIVVAFAFFLVFERPFMSSRQKHAVRDAEASLASRIGAEQTAEKGVKV